MIFDFTASAMFSWFLQEQASFSVQAMNNIPVASDFFVIFFNLEAEIGLLLNFIKYRYYIAWTIVQYLTDIRIDDLQYLKAHRKK